MAGRGTLREKSADSLRCWGMVQNPLGPRRVPGPPQVQHGCNGQMPATQWAEQGRA